MFFSKFSAILALVPLLTLGSSTSLVAQSQDPYQDWTYLYEDTFEDSSGEQVTQQWWLNPEFRRNNNLLNFTLLARRNPISSNGTAAAVFDYVADCDTISYSMEKATFLDSNNAALDTQTVRRAMDKAEPGDEFYDVLTDLCSGVY